MTTWAATGADGEVTLVDGEPFTITVDDIQGDQTRVSTTYKGLPGDVSAGDLLEMDVAEVAQLLAAVPKVRRPLDLLVRLAWQELPRDAAKWLSG